MANANVTVDYNDERFKNVESDKAAAMSDVNNTYDPMINQSDKFYDAQINASKDWAGKQTQLQQERSDFAIEQIEQQKDQAKKDYTKEQSGAYVDWQKESNRYGANAEQLASQGFGNTGYSESSQVNLYNTYQKRVASARESYRQAILSYDNAIKDARLQNNSALAEIAYNALKEQLALSLEGFQYKNSLILEKANRKTELDNMYYGRYQDVLQQINSENALAEEIRQYNETLAEQKRQYDADLLEKQRQYNETLAEEQRQYDAKYGDGGGGLIVKGPDTGNLDEFPSPISNIFKGVAGVGEAVKNAFSGGAGGGKGNEKPSYHGGKGGKISKKPSYSSISSDIEMYISAGASVDELTSYINAAYKEGYITKAERDGLIKRIETKEHKKLIVSGPGGERYGAI